MLKIIMFISLILTFSLQASEKMKILDIVSTENNKDSAAIYIITNGNKIQSFELKTENKTMALSLREINKGKTLLRKKGIKVIYIKAKEFSQDKGGKFNIRFLKKFKIFNSIYENLIIDLERESHTWRFKKGGITVKKIQLTPYSLGISQIELI